MHAFDSLSFVITLLMSFVLKCLWYSFILQITHCRVEGSATVRHEDEYFSRCFHLPILTWDGGTIIVRCQTQIKPVDSRCIHFRQVTSDGNPKLSMHQDLRGTWSRKMLPWSMPLKQMRSTESLDRVAANQTEKQSNTAWSLMPLPFCLNLDAKCQSSSKGETMRSLIP